MRAAIASILSFCSTEGPASLFLPIQARLLVRPLYRPFQSSSRVDGAGTSWRFEDPLSHTTKNANPPPRTDAAPRYRVRVVAAQTPPAHSGGGNDGLGAHPSRDGFWDGVDNAIVAAATMSHVTRAIAARSCWVARSAGDRPTMRLRYRRCPQPFGAHHARHDLGK